jgi:hypothetical protein
MTNGYLQTGFVRASLNVACKRALTDPKSALWYASQGLDHAIPSMPEYPALVSLVVALGGNPYDL